MSSNRLEAAAARAKQAQTFTETEPAAERSTTPAKKRAARRSKPRSKPSAASQASELDPEAADLLELARAEAEAAKAAAGTDRRSRPNLTEGQRRELRALRQQTRRAKLARIDVEISRSARDRFEELAKHYGSQRAAIEALIDQAKVPDKSVED